MKHIHAIIGGLIIMVAVIREAKRNPQAVILADLDEEDSDEKL